jgi:WD40 repeat protein
MTGMKSPFKFLDSYTKNDREVFFGRDHEIEELYHRVFESKIMLVYGVSGTGKSSLIHCGLANKFQDTDWLPIVIRRGGNIIDSMAAGIKGASITEQQSKFLSPADFKKGVRSLYLDHYKPVFFLFDQFEELFIFGDKEERRTFIHIIKSLVESDLQCRLIFVMREEYMAWVTEFEKFIPTFFSNRVRIEKMSHRNALEAIKGPCNVFNISLEEGFAEALLEKLSPGETDIELTYLQVFLDKIYQLAIGFLPPPGGELKGGSSSPGGESKGVLSFTLELLSKTGNVSDLLGSFLEEQLSLLDNPETSLAVLKSFVSVKGTKQPMKPEEAKEYVLTLGTDVNEAIINELIQTFVNLRILCDKDQNGRYELRHDALAAKIFEKFTMAEKELLEVRKFVENAFYTYEKRGIMLNKQDLDYLKTYENSLILPQHLNDFVKQSRDKLLIQKRALRRITSISALIFILIIAGVARKYFRGVESDRDKSKIGTIMLQSETFLLQGLVNALELSEKYPLSSVLKRIILSDFQKLLKSNVDTADPVYLLQKEFEQFKVESPVINAEISKEGNCIYGWMENYKIFVFNLLTNKITYLNTDSEPLHLEISEKDSLIAIVYIDNEGIVFDFRGNKRYTFKTTANDVMNERLIRFFPKGDYQLAVADGNNAKIYDKTGNAIFELKGHRDKINSVDVSPDGRFVVTASCDKQGLIWNYNIGANQFSVYDTLIGHKDTIWSCEFNKTGKYIITASSDSTIRIWDLNGSQINPWYGYGMNYKGQPRYRLNKGEPDEDKSDPLLSSYYGKNCNAHFSKDELSIVATGYAYDTNSIRTLSPYYSQVLFYDSDSKFQGLYYNTFIDVVRTDNERNNPERFDRLTVSPTGEIVAGIHDATNKVSILGPEGLQLLSMEGNYAFFQNNGRYLFFINKNLIYKFPVDINEIRYCLDKFKIPESVKGGKGFFKVL